MIDTKMKTLLAVVQTGSYTKAAESLCLTQPAVSHHIKLLEQEYDIKIFYKDKKELKLTPEGAILLKYAKRVISIANNARQSIEDSKKQVSHLMIGMTQTVGENLMPQILAIYCNEHPHTSINICTDTINNIYDKLKNYELDLAIVEGKLPDPSFTSVLLDTDYLCLIVSPEHAFAKKGGVSLEELRLERFILRSENAGTRTMFSEYLSRNGEDIDNFNIIMELDNVSMIKELVAHNMGISIVAHSICKEDVLGGKLVVVPIANANMVREINIVHHRDFIHTEIMDDLRKIYSQLH